MYDAYKNTILIQYKYILLGISLLSSNAKKVHTYIAGHDAGRGSFSRRVSRICIRVHICWFPEQSDSSADWQWLRESARRRCRSVRNCHSPAQDLLQIGLDLGPHWVQSSQFPSQCSCCSSFQTAVMLLVRTVTNTTMHWCWFGFFWKVPAIHRSQDQRPNQKTSITARPFARFPLMILKKWKRQKLKSQVYGGRCETRCRLLQRAKHGILKILRPTFQPQDSA